MNVNDFLNFYNKEIHKEEPVIEEGMFDVDDVSNNEPLPTPEVEKGIDYDLLASKIADILTNKKEKDE